MKDGKYRCMMRVGREGRRVISKSVSDELHVERTSTSELEGSTTPCSQTHPRLDEQGSERTRTRQDKHTISALGPTRTEHRTPLLNPGAKSLFSSQRNHCAPPAHPGSLLFWLLLLLFVTQRRRHFSFTPLPSFPLRFMLLNPALPPASH